MRTNIPFTHKLVKSLQKGFHSSGQQPNRKKRRKILQKQTHNPAFGKMVERIQYAINKHTGKEKIIYHFPTNIDFQ
jgi:hypothetical protein